MKQLKDHRQLGKEMRLFIFNEDHPGMPYWLPKGKIVYQALLGKIKKILSKYNYQEISGPLLNSSSLLKVSGHWEKYEENIFKVSREKHEYALKAMNCPNAIHIFRSFKRSHRELPLRFSDHSPLFRKELSGSLSGLFRVQQFQQDDAHIFVREKDISKELDNLFNLVKEVYDLFGLDFSLRLGKCPVNFIGDKKLWEKSENMLKRYMVNKGLCFQEVEGEGAFYGPKIDILVKDYFKRKWQLGSIQLDFNLPKRFNLSFVNEKGEREAPVIIHRAILGSFERFLAILLEHYQGVLPSFMSPVQLLIIPVNEKYIEHAEELKEKFKNLRVVVDDSNEQFSKKIRNARISKNSFYLCVGGREVKNKIYSLESKEGKKEISYEELLSLEL